MQGRAVRGVIAAIVSLSIAACSGSTGAVAGPSGSAAPAASLAAPSATPGHPVASATARTSTTPGPGDVVYDGRIDVGGGRKIQVRCVGIGTPTIVLEGGGTSASIDAYPSTFANELGKITTTCQYSHAGAGTSTALPGLTTMAAVVDDAYAMLAALNSQANVPGPYVFVGWSFGGTIALAEALARPEQTAGLVILDTDFVTDFMSNCVKSGRSRADCQQEYQDDIDAKSLEQELLPEIHPLPDIPMRIVSAMRFPDCDPSRPETLKADISGLSLTATDCTDLAEVYASQQHKGWSTVQPQLQQTRVEADHDGLIREAGGQIVAIILDVVRQARADP